MINIFGIGERNQNMVIFVFNVVITIAATAFVIFVVAEIAVNFKDIIVGQIIGHILGYSWMIV